MSSVHYILNKESDITSQFDEPEVVRSQTSAGTISPSVLLPKVLLWQFPVRIQSSVKIVPLDTSSGAIIGMEMHRIPAYGEESLLTYDPFSMRPANTRFMDTPVFDAIITISFQDFIIYPEHGERVRQGVIEAPHKEEASSEALAAQRAKNEAAILLLQDWLADESGYDEAVWPKVKRAIEEHRLSDRKRFND